MSEAPKPFSPETGKPESSTESPENGALRVVKDIEGRLTRELPRLPEPQKQQVNRVVREVILERSASFSGPLPPPELLAHYDQVSPGSAAQILQMALDEQKHRHICDVRELDQNDELIRLQHRDASYSMTGLILGFLAFLLIAGVGVLAMMKGNAAVAAACFSTFVVGVLGVFVKGRQTGWTRQENSEPPAPNVTEKKSPKAGQKTKR